MRTGQPPDRLVPTPPARFWERALARVIDGMFCLFVPTTIASFVAMATSDVVFYPIVFGILLTYFAVGPHFGGTLGERGLSLLVIDAGTGKPPGIIGSIARSIGTTLFIVSVIGILAFGFSDEPDAGYSATDLWIVGVLAGVLLLSIAARLWMFADREHRTLTDRVAGVVVLHQVERDARVAGEPPSPREA